MVGIVHGNGTRQKGDPIDERAAAYLVDSDAIILHPTGLTNRLVVNSPLAFEFDNEVFVGRVVILHREPVGRPGIPSPYRSLFEAKRRRWELRWQGQFKKPVLEQVVFGAEVGAKNMPKFNFAMRTIVSVLTKFAGKLARSRGSDMYTNVVDHKVDEETIFFRFPVIGSDLILATPPNVVPPSIVSTGCMRNEAPHVDGSGHFRGQTMNVLLDYTYTFVFYSMYADFVYWDLQNVPMGFSGMSLNRLVGSQPISVSMRSSSSREVYFRLLIGNRCSSPEWASYLSSSAHNSLFNDNTVRSEFFSAVSDEDYRIDTMSQTVHGDVAGNSDRPPSRRRKRFSWLWRGIKRIVWTPTKYIGVCLRAPASIIWTGSPSEGGRSCRLPIKSGSRTMDIPPGRPRRVPAQRDPAFPDIIAPIPENS